MKTNELLACHICEIHEPANTLTDGVCIECIKEGRTKAEPDRKNTIPTKKERKPIGTDIFLWGALISFCVGLYVVIGLEKFWGLTLILTVTPCLLLYPLVRLLFGGKDSIGAVVVTFITEEYLKSKVVNAIKKSNEKRHK